MTNKITTDRLPFLNFQPGDVVCYTGDVRVQVLGEHPVWFVYVSENRLQSLGRVLGTPIDITPLTYRYPPRTVKSSDMLSCQDNKDNLVSVIRRTCLEVAEGMLKEVHIYGAGDIRITDFAVEYSSDLVSWPRKVSATFATSITKF